MENQWPFQFRVIPQPAIQNINILICFLNFYIYEFYSSKIFTWSSKPFALTKSSDTTIAAAEPSEVGQHCNLVSGSWTDLELSISSKVYSSWNCDFLCEWCKNSKSILGT